MTRVGLIGECMIELTVDGNDPQTAGVAVAGDMLNMAVYLKRSAGRDVDVAFITRLGIDSFSDRSIELMRSEGLDTGSITRHPTRLPGIYAIEVDAHGERRFSYWREQSAARTMFDSGDDAFSVLEGFDLLGLSAISLAILSEAVRARLLQWLDFYRRKGGLVAFDSNYRPHLWPDVASARSAVESLWRRCDIALPSLDDEMTLFADRDANAVLARFASYKIGRGALKRGRLGPLPIAGAVVGKTFKPATRVVDTTAAGDSFNAAYLATILAGHPDEDALAAGHALASHVIGYRGAIVPSTPLAGLRL